MTAVNLAPVMTSLRDLPALPSIVLDLIHTLGRENVDVTALAEKMSRDQALAAKMLRLANSSFYGLAGKVKTVKQAIVVLGFDSARALVVASNVIGGIQGGASRQVDVADFWRHSIATALCAKNLARQAGIDPDAAFIAGLLHDIGRLVLATRFPAEYARVQDDCERNDTPVDAAELRVFGLDHQRAGQMLAEAWKFPPLILRAIGQHHAPASADLGDLPGVVHAANAMVHALDLGGGRHVAVPRLLDAAWDSLGLTPEHLLTVCRDTEGQFEETCRLLM
jgi:putative nucleotidyltransferase with HDIG domain